MNATNPQERLLDLLADRALVGLDNAEDAELGRLLAEHPEGNGWSEALELAAAAVAVAGVAGQGLLRMPDAVAQRLEQVAQPTTVRIISIAPPARPSQRNDAPAPAPPAAQVIPLRRSRASRAIAVSGWIAAAACLMLVAGTWYYRPRTKVVAMPAPSVTALPVTTASAPPPPPTPAQERESLIARAGSTRVEWKKNPKDPASKQASGDVVWNTAEQRGYMRFQGLAKNDARANVYQLWIFDKQRDDKYPVDGGVFTIDDESGDVIVPIKARLPVGEVALFAVTVEKPGGVVVSKRERIVVTAKPVG